VSAFAATIASPSASPLGLLAWPWPSLRTRSAKSPGASPARRVVEPTLPGVGIGATWPPLILAAEPAAKRYPRGKAREERLLHLVDLYLTGKEDAFNEIAELIRDQVYSVAWRYCGNRDDALDILQNVLVRVFRALPKWKGQCSFATWVHRIAMNASVDFLRRQTKHADHRVDPEEVKRHEEGRGSSDPFLGVAPDTPRHAAQRREVVKRLVATLPQLSEMQRECFALRHFHGMSIEEIAATAECSQGSVKRHLFRATRRLRELLADLEPMLEGGTLTPQEE
jgi:RNA polymerase sigma-70 factor (ECF subfamily)